MPREGGHGPLVTKVCPKCESSEYRFRSRRKVADEHGEAVETAYRCVVCGHEWRVRSQA
jgi:DNA-directed RNA polymerase subunit M/transcription elongation factor TFIIS